VQINGGYAGGGKKKKFPGGEASEKEYVAKEKNSYRTGTWQRRFGELRGKRGWQKGGEPL